MGSLTYFKTVMKRLFALLLASSLLLLKTALCADAQYRFFDDKDLANIKASAQTDWGKKIVEKLKSQIAEREKFGFELPTKITSRGQNYVCPVDFTELEIRLDDPKWHVCPICKKNYEGEYYDAGWRNKYQHSVHPYILNCAFVYAATQDPAYAKKAKDLILKYAEIYPNFPNFSAEFLARKNNGYWGKMFEQWLEDSGFFADVCPAYELVRETFTPQEREKVEKNLFREGANMISARHDKYNWQAWNNACRACLGVVLKDQKLIDSALEGKYGFHEQFPTMVSSDSWVYELSAGYHYYALKAMLLTANALRNSGINLFDEKFVNMFKNVPNCLNSDMTFPAIGDCGYATTMNSNAETYEIALARTGDKQMLEMLSRIYASSPRNSKYALLNNFEIKPDNSPFTPASSNFEVAGIASLRDGKNTLTMLYGYSDNDHTHADKLSIAYHDGAREILLDPGTFSYSTPVYINWHKQTLSHNTLVVDSKSMNIKNPKAAGKVKNFKADEGGAEIEVECDGLFEGVKLTRKCAVKDGGLSDNFKAESESEHTYDYVLNFFEKPQLPAQTKKVKFAEQGGAYKFLKNSEAAAFKDFLAFKVGGREFKVKNNLGGEMIAIVSEAPEVITRTHPPRKVYSLIIRTRAKNMDLSMSMSKPE